MEALWDSVAMKALKLSEAIKVEHCYLTARQHFGGVLSRSFCRRTNLEKLLGWAAEPIEEPLLGCTCVEGDISLSGNPIYTAAQYPLGRRPKERHLVLSPIRYPSPCWG